MGRQRLLPNLLLALVSGGLCLGLLEGAARILEWRAPKSHVADYIVDWQKKWDKDFYTVSSEAVGWPPWEDFNGDGVRDRPHTVEKPEGVSRVVVLGDSVAMGAGIQPKEAFPQRLEARLEELGRPVEVFNISLWGWSTRQEAIAYRNIARQYKPDSVILAVCLNDIPELQNNLSRPPHILVWLHERSALVRYAVGAREREIGSVEELFTDSPKVQEAFRKFFEEVKNLQKEVGGDGAQFAVLVFPFRFQVEAHAPLPVAQERIASFCLKEGIAYIDMLPPLGPLGAKAFVDYDHLSPLGAQTTADFVLEHGPIAKVPSYSDTLGGRAPTALLTDSLPGLRAAAAWALERDEAAARTSAPALLRALGDPNARVRGLVVSATGAAGSKDAIPRLFEALGDPSQDVRWRAARALHRIGLEAPRDVAPLSRALSSPDSYVRGFAAWSLGNMGTAAGDAVPALIEALSTDEAYGRGGAAAALGKIGPTAGKAVPALALGLKDPDATRRAHAARTLGRIGPAASSAIPALIQCLEDEDAVVRAQAARALGRIGPRADGVSTALKRATKDPERSVQKEAEAALR
jgi:HEAT repeat protein